MKVWICSDASYGGDITGVSLTLEGAKKIGKKYCDNKRELAMKAFELGEGTPVYKIPRRDVKREIKEWEEYTTKWDDNQKPSRGVHTATPNNHREGLIITPPNFFIQEFEIEE